MDPESTVSSLYELHSCYEIHDVSFILTSNPTPCVLFSIFFCLLSVVTVWGNLLVIISIIYFKQLHTPTNYLILSLAVADLLVGVVVCPFSMAFSFSSCLFTEDIFCNIQSSFDISLSTASILNLCCVSVLVAIGFIVSGINQEKYEENCFIDALLANILGPIFAFYLPVIIMLCLYIKIFIVARRQARSIQNTTCQSTMCGAAVSKMERKATKTLATVMGVFLMCWTPFFLCFAFQFLNDVSVPLSVFETLSWLALSNLMLSPFIYSFVYSWFRSAFRMIISGKIFQGNFVNTKLL